VKPTAELAVEQMAAAPPKDSTGTLLAPAPGKTTVAINSSPATATEAFAEHMKAVFAKDKEAILRGFTEASRFRVYWGNTGEFNEYVGLAGIWEWYETVFYANLEALSDLRAPIQGREDNMCFFAWEAPKCGFTRCFDTVVFEDTADGWKIKYQNVTGSKN
jgi:hypothetical protein